LRHCTKHTRQNPETLLSSPIPLSLIAYILTIAINNSRKIFTSPIDLFLLVVQSNLQICDLTYKNVGEVKFSDFQSN
jgi:hypothetical protein